MKKMLCLCIRGIGIALSLFVVLTIVFEARNEGEVFFCNWSYSKMVLGAVLVGIGFSVPGLIYDNANIPYAMKVLIHMGIGCLVLFVVGGVVGWVSVGYGWKECFISIGVEVIIAFSLWFGFSLYYKNEAKKLNERLKQIEQSKQ